VAVFARRRSAPYEMSLGASEVIVSSMVGQSRIGGVEVGLFLRIIRVQYSSICHRAWMDYVWLYQTISIGIPQELDIDGGVVCYDVIC